MVSTMRKDMGDISGIDYLVVDGEIATIASGQWEHGKEHYCCDLGQAQPRREILGSSAQY